MTNKCERCGRDFEVRIGRGRPAMYCSGTCRTMACVERRNRVAETHTITKSDLEVICCG